MSYDLDEQEQLENIKAWWERYGNIISNIIIAISISASIFFAYKWWHNFQEKKAYALVTQINNAINNKKYQEVGTLANSLIKDQPSSTHTALGALRASEALASKDINKSIEILSNVANNPKQEHYSTLIKYRLSSFLIDAKKYDEAIKILETTNDNQIWQGLFYDRLGDAQIAKGDIIKAKVAYEKAIKFAQDTYNNELEEFVKLKININNQY